MGLNYFLQPNLVKVYFSKTFEQRVVFMLPPRALYCASVIAKLYICLYCLTLAVAKHQSVNLEKRKC